ncbi:MAG: hypothetical protein JNM03_10500, partial [Sphingopyxis sp.]|nr:hypothetical protein [Sphingopyxis sp.]
MIVFLEVTPRWPIASDPICACSAADRRAQTWDGAKWAAAVHDPGSLQVSLFNGDIGSEIDSQTAPVILTEKHLLKLYPDARTVRWEGATFRMWAGDFTTPAGIGAYPYANTVELVAKGKVSRFEQEGGAIKLSLDPAGEAGQTNVLSLEYAGTGAVEGGADLKGKLKPWVFGHAKNVEPVLINEDYSVYQFSAYGPIQAVDALYERGSDFGAPTADYASYALLIAATIPAGRWATCLAEGLIRLGAPQYGVITGDVRGDYAGSVQRRHPGAILQRIATYRSISSDAINSDSLDALDAFAATLPAGGYINEVLTEQTTFLDLARRLASGFNAQAGFTLLGELIVTRVSIGTPDFTIHSQGKFLPVVGSFVESDTPPPFKRIIMAGDRSWRVHDLANDIAFYATPLELGVYDPVETYREGNIVSLPDGSRWIYSNPVPTSGNLPSDASLYWSRLSEAVSGSPGPDGVSNAVVYLYRRGATSPAVPTGTFTYTFATGVLSGGTLNSWTQAIPAADGNPLWVIAATASAAAATDTIAAAEFASPVLKDGAGLNTAPVVLYQRAASAPSVPAGTLTYTFSTATLSGTLGSWTQSVPANDGNPVYVITATALSTAATDTIPTGEWSAPQILAENGAPGAPGTDGVTLYTWYAYADAPDGSFNFTTGAPGSRTYQGIATGKTTATESTDPADYVWSPYVGPPNFGLANFNSNTVLAGNKLIKVAGGESWNASVHSTESYTGGASVSFVVDDVTKSFMVGLSSDPTTDASYTSIDFAIQFFPDLGSDIGVYEDGNFVTSMGTPYTAGDVFSATYNDKSVVYSKNGIPFHINSGVPSGLTLFFDSSLNTPGQSGRILSFTAAGTAGTDGNDGISPVSAVAIPLNKQFTADSDGTVKAGQLPFNVAISGTKAGASIGGTVSIGTPSGCTATAISGGFTIDTVSADSGFVPWTFTATDGQVVDGKVSFSRQRDPASGGQVSVNFSSTSWWGSGSYGSSGPSTVLPASSTGKLAISGFASFYCSGNGEARLTAKLQYRAVGSGTWIDAGFSSGPGIAIKTADMPGEPGENTPGEVNPTGTLTGLTANGSYEVQMVGSRNASYNAIAAAT